MNQKPKLEVNVNLGMAQQNARVQIKSVSFSKNLISFKKRAGVFFTLSLVTVLCFQRRSKLSVGNANFNYKTIEKGPEKLKKINL